MMKQYILVMLFTLAGLAGMAQTNETLPGDAEPLTNQLYLSPSDSTVWAADPFSGLAIKVGTWFKVDSLNKTRQKAFALDVTDFGAVGDSSTINTDAFYDAFDFATSNGFKYIYVPTGTYLVDSIINLPRDISMFGDGYSSCIIPTGDASDYVHSSGSSGVLYNNGYQTLIGNVPAAVPAGTKFIKSSTLAASFNENDLLKIADTASYSYSGYRADQKQGEYFVVWKKNVDTLFLDHPVSESYANASSTLVYKMTISDSSLEDIRIWQDSSSPTVPRVIWDLVGNTRLRNVYTAGARTGNIRVSNAYNIVLDQITSLQTLPRLSGQPETQYGLVIGGIQNFTIINSNLFAYRHAFTTIASGVLSRFGTIYNCKLYSAESYAADLHGGSSTITIDNCVMTGTQLRGEKHILRNSTVLPYSANAFVMQLSEIKRLDFTISGNRIYSPNTFLNIDVVTTWSGNPSTTYEPELGGTLRITDNIFEGTNTGTSTPSNVAIRTTYDRGLTRNLQATVDFSNNQVLCFYTTAQNINIEGYSNSYRLGNVTASNNRIEGARFRGQYLTSFISANNSFGSLPANAYYVNRTNNVSITNNNALGICSESGLSTNDQCFAMVQDAGNVVINGNTVLQRSNATQSIRYQTVFRAIIGTNFFGDILPLYSSVSNTNYLSAAQLKLEALNSAPSSSTASGQVGDIRIASGYVYVCTATNTWVRAALTTW